MQHWSAIPTDSSVKVKEAEEAQAKKAKEIEETEVKKGKEEDKEKDKAPETANGDIKQGDKWSDITPGSQGKRMSLFTSAPLQNKNAVFGERKIMHLSSETIFLSSHTCNAAAYKVCNNTKSYCNKDHTPYLQQKANKFFSGN